MCGGDSGERERERERQRERDVPGTCALVFLLLKSSEIILFETMFVDDIFLCNANTFHYCANIHKVRTKMYQRIHY